MDAITLEALKASIAKWEANANVEKRSEAKIFYDSCPLCSLYYDKGGDYVACCNGCPVRDKTGHRGCYGTPWDYVEEEYYNWESSRSKKRRDAFREAARAEVDFLKSLLPAEESADA